MLFFTFSLFLSGQKPEGGFLIRAGMALPEYAYLGLGYSF